MEEDIHVQLARIEQKVDAAYQSAERTRKYMMWSAIIAVAVIVLPLLVLPFVLGPFIDTYSSLGSI